MPVCWHGIERAIKRKTIGMLITTNVINTFLFILCRIIIVLFKIKETYNDNKTIWFRIIHVKFKCSINEKNPFANRIDKNVLFSFPKASLFYLKFSLYKFLDLNIYVKYSFYLSLSIVQQSAASFCLLCLLNESNQRIDFFLSCLFFT